MIDSRYCAFLKKIFGASFPVVAYIKSRLGHFQESKFPENEHNGDCERKYCHNDMIKSAIPLHQDDPFLERSPAAPWRRPARLNVKRS